MKLRPHGPSLEAPQAEEEYYFEPVYFDILDGRIKKITETEKKAHL